MLNKILKNVSAFLVAIIIVNSFMFAILVSPKPAKAGPDPVQNSLTAAQTAKQSVWQSINTIWDKKESVLSRAYETAVVSFQAWEKSEGILGKVSYTLMYITVNIMLAKMTQDIVKWIDGGANGSPKIFQDFGGELENAADLAGGAVIGQLLGIDSKTLCNPDFVKTDLVIAFDKYISPPIFQDKLKCSFTGGLKAWKDFQEDFTKGGWKSWIELSRRENNQLGTFMMTQEELGKSVVAGQSKVQQDIDIGNGFKPQEVCRVTKNIDMGTYAANQSAVLGGFGGSGQELIGESVVAARQGSRGATETAFTLGAELKDLMPKFNWPGDDLEGFKGYWVANGGEFKCKTQTPAQIIADITSKAITGPFEAMNDAIAASLSNIGKSAPSILQPYLNAISASAMNLLVKKEKGLISAAIKPTPPRRERRQSSDSFKDANAALSASQSILSATSALRDMLMKTLLSFSVFTGVVQKILEGKEILYNYAIVPDEVNDNGLVSNYIAYWPKNLSGDAGQLLIRSDLFPIDPIISSKLQDDYVNSETSRVVNARTISDLPKSFPTLPVSGTMNIVAESCKAPVQEIAPKWLIPTNTILSTAQGFIDTATGTFIPIASATNSGWFGNTRIIAFDDTGDGALDRFIREIDNAGSSSIMTFIDTQQGLNRIKIGTPNTADEDFYETLYTSEIANFSVADEKNNPRLDTNNDGLLTIPPDVPYPRIYYTGNPTTIADNVTGGNIFVIEGNKYPGAINISPPPGAVNVVAMPTSDFCVDHKYGLRYEKIGSIGSLYAGGNGMDDPSWGGQCGGDEELVATFDWGALGSSDEVMTTVTFEDDRCSPNTLSIYLNNSTVNLTMYETGASCGAGGQQSPYISNVDTTIKQLNMLGIPAYYEDSNYWLKFFSPAFDGATAQIENLRRNVIYDDILDNNKKPQNLQNTLTRNDDASPSFTQNLPYAEHNNPNPYKMTLVDFYDQLQDTLNAFTVKIRVLLGYSQSKNKITHLSGLADQIGAVPDDDPTSTSTSDVLIKYNNLSDLYQTLFVGVSSEETLEGIDPNYNILNPVETNIRLALIGQKCPTIPPTASSSSDLIDGCGRFGADPTNTLTRTTTGEYNMAKRFIFQKNVKTGFATNPFTNELSNPLAGILNLDEMAQQLASLPPDKNVIKLIRIRQILEQLQVLEQLQISPGEIKQISPGEIKIEGKKSGILPPPLLGVDIVRVNLRNYPEIEAYLNDITTADKPITDLAYAYGYEDPADAKKAYPIISNDLEEVLPDIVTQISDKLKDVFLKRTELELENAKTEAQERLLDFIHYAYDLNPAIQLQLDRARFADLAGATMQVGDSHTKIIRVVASELSNDNILNPDGSIARDKNGNPYLAPSENHFIGLGPCMSISGDQIECGTAEFDLRGFETVSWGRLRRNMIMIMGISEEDSSRNIAIRQSLMAGIRNKIKEMSKMLGVDVTSTSFEAKIATYYLPTDKDPGTGAFVVDTAMWDDLIQKGLEDVNSLFTAVYSSKTAGSINNPGLILNFFGSSNKPLATDIKTKMEILKDNFPLIQTEIENIINMFSSSEASSLISTQSDMEEINKLLATMEASEEKALACATTKIRTSSNTLLILASGGFAGYAATFLHSNPIGWLVTGGMLLGGFIYDSIWGKKKRKKKAKAAANKCNAAAFEYNKALLQLTNKFVCGQTWQEPQQ